MPSEVSSSIQAAQGLAAQAIKDANGDETKVKEAKRTKGLLWDVYDAVEDFYNAASDLVKAMRRSDDDECDERQLKKVIGNWNSMVDAFDKVPSIDLGEAKAEINRNGMAQVELACDGEDALDNKKPLA